MATEIKLADPQFLIATAENAKEYQFLLVRSKPQYTKEGFEKNPNLAAGDDLLFKSDLVADQNGQAAVPLKAKVKEIGDKLKDPETPVTGVLIGTEKGVLQRKTVITKDFVIKKDAAIKLKGIRAFAEPSHWVAYHHAVCYIGMEITGPIKQVVIDTEPKPYNVAPGAVGVFIPTAPGAMTAKSFVIGSMGDAHAAAKPPETLIGFSTEGWQTGDAGHLFITARPVAEVLGDERMRGYGAGHVRVVQRNEMVLSQASFEIGGPGLSFPPDAPYNENDSRSYGSFRAWVDGVLVPYPIATSYGTNATRLSLTPQAQAAGWTSSPVQGKNWGCIVVRPPPSLAKPAPPVKDGGCSAPASMHGNYALWSRCFSDGHKTTINLPENEKNFTIGLYPRATGKCVLRVYGVGAYAQVMDQIEFGFNGNHPHPGD